MAKNKKTCFVKEFYCSRKRVAVWGRFQSHFPRVEHLSRVVLVKFIFGRTQTLSAIAKN